MKYYLISQWAINTFLFVLWSGNDYFNTLIMGILFFMMCWNTFLIVHFY